MSNCLNTIPTQGCFYPTSGADPVSILIHTVYREGKGVAYTYTDSATDTPIDAATYLGGGSVSVGVCKYSREAVAVDEDRTTNSTMPAGFIHGSIAVRSGQITVNGAVYDAGDSISLPPMSYGDNAILYPQYDIVVTGGGGTSYRINYLA